MVLKHNMACGRRNGQRHVSPDVGTIALPLSACIAMDVACCLAVFFSGCLVVIMMWIGTATADWRHFGAFVCVLRTLSYLPMVGHVASDDPCMWIRIAVETCVQRWWSLDLMSCIVDTWVQCIWMAVDSCDRPLRDCIQRLVCLCIANDVRWNEFHIDDSYVFDFSPDQCDGCHGVAWMQLISHAFDDTQETQSADLLQHSMYIDGM